MGPERVSCALSSLMWTQKLLLLMRNTVWVFACRKKLSVLTILAIWQKVRRGRGDYASDAPSSVSSSVLRLQKIMQSGALRGSASVFATFLSVVQRASWEIRQLRQTSD